MITANDILSKVQTDLNDASGIVFQEAELVDVFNETLQEVARETELWISTITLTPVTATPASPVHEAILTYTQAGQTLAADKIIALYREDVLQTSVIEVPYMSVEEQKLNGYRVPKTNATHLVDTYSIHINFDGSMVFRFKRAIEVNEDIIIHYISNSPIQASTYAVANSQFNQAVIPSFMGEAIRLGIMYRFMTKRYAKGNERYRNRMVDFDNLYRKELARQVEYSKEYKTVTRSPILEPYRF